MYTIAFKTIQELYLTTVKNSSGYILQTIAQTKLQIQKKNIYIYVTLENLLSMSAVGTKVYVI